MQVKGTFSRREKQANWSNTGDMEIGSGRNYAFGKMWRTRKGVALFSKEPECTQDEKTRRINRESAA